MLIFQERCFAQVQRITDCSPYQWHTSLCLTSLGLSNRFCAVLVFPFGDSARPGFSYSRRRGNRRQTNAPPQKSFLNLPVNHPGRVCKALLFSSFYFPLKNHKPLEVFIHPFTSSTELHSPYGAASNVLCRRPLAHRSATKVLDRCTEQRALCIVEHRRGRYLPSRDIILFVLRFRWSGGPCL